MNTMVNIILSISALMTTSFLIGVYIVVRIVLLLCAPVWFVCHKLRGTV